MDKIKCLLIALLVPICVCACTHEKVTFEDLLAYEDVAVSETVAVETEEPTQIPSGFVEERLELYKKPEKYTYDMLVSDISILESVYANDLSIQKLCTTYDGRTVYDIVVGDLNNENHIMVSAAMHAREYITTQVVMNELCDLLSAINSDEVYNDVLVSRLVNNVTIHFIPMVNPDGVSISQFGLDGLLTQQAVDTVNGICVSNNYYNYEQWKANAEGIDINRNFDAGWEEYNDTKDKPAPDKYKGEYPGSAAEALALIELTEEYNFKRTISYHTKGSLIYWYYKQSGEVLEDSKKFSQSISNVTGYVLDGDYTAVDAAGYKDWAVYKKGIPSITIEVGGEAPDNPVPISYLDSILKRNENVVYETLYGLQ